MGRPRRYAQAVADRICARLLEGRSLKSICQDPGMPTASAVFRWLAEDLVFARRYPLVHGYERLGGDCGVISKGAVAADGQRAIWMSAGKFFSFDGLAVQPVDCDVDDYLFGEGGLNRTQASKVSAFLNSDFDEAWWFYPRGEATENSHYVFFNFRTGRWGFGALARTCAAAKGVFDHPLMVGADGYIYEHEKGHAYPEAEPARPFAETGPIEVGAGDRMMEVQGFLPDERDAGAVELTVHTRAYPNAPEMQFGPFQANGDGRPMSFLLQGRQVRLRFTATGETDFRVGQGRLDVVDGDAF